MSDLAVNDRVTIPAAELRVGFARSGGPGGQNVNKVETKVEIRWTPADSEALSDADRQWLLERLARRLTTAGELIVTSERTRDQARNREDALAKLARIVGEALERPTPRKRTHPSRTARERRLTEKRKQSERKRRRRSPPDDA